jgi:hypothetical protein
VVLLAVGPLIETAGFAVAAPTSLSHAPSEQAATSDAKGFVGINRGGCSTPSTRAGTIGVAAVDQSGQAETLIYH